MTTKEIADRLVELCRKGDFETAQKELFSDNATSIEPYSTPAFEKETRGLQAIFKKGKKWQNMVQEIRGVDVSEPLIASGSFACTMKMDVTMKEVGDMDMCELCVYETKDGKILSEQFFV